ncbi:protease inhibitor I42 family protein [Clostridium thailandense]|uniref:protease inhibitor I42 family protein n=1 Tax=Clostridium thailandense TaxID=2794346 RepID=UPI003989B522
MRKLNKLILTTLSYTACLLFVLCSKTLASGAPSSDALSIIQDDSILNWTKLPTKEDVSVNKAWSIKFTKPINKESLSNYSIYVKDDKYNIVDTNFQQSEDGQTINIFPTSNYFPGHSYSLYVTNRVKSTSNQSLYNPTYMNFTINVDAIKVDNTYNNQNIKLKKGDILELTLPENYDGGYSWQFKPSLDNNMFKIIDDIFIAPDVPPNVIGGVGRRRWLIQATGTGSTSINLEESRPWDSNSTLSNFNFTVTVK